jgi:hypothetical protein
MLDTLDLDGGHRGALERREQDATQRVADGRTHAALKRLNSKTPEGIRGELGVRDHLRRKFQSTPAYTHVVDLLSKYGSLNRVHRSILAHRSDALAEHVVLSFHAEHEKHPCVFRRVGALFQIRRAASWVDGSRCAGPGCDLRSPSHADPSRRAPRRRSRVRRRRR